MKYSLEIYVKEVNSNFFGDFAMKIVELDNLEINYMWKVSLDMLEDGFIYGEIDIEEHLVYQIEKIIFEVTEGNLICFVPLRMVQ